MAKLKNKFKGKHFKSAAQLLVELINATGGVIEDNGLFLPCGDEDWTDLGDAYYAACVELGVEPKVTKREEGEDLRTAEGSERLYMSFLKSTGG